MSFISRENLYGVPCSLLAFTFAFLCRIHRLVCQTQHKECWEISPRLNGGQFVVQNDKPCETLWGSERDVLWLACTYGWWLEVSVQFFSLTKQSHVHVLHVIALVLLELPLCQAQWNHNISSRNTWQTEHARNHCLQIDHSSLPFLPLLISFTYFLCFATEAPK